MADILHDFPIFAPPERVFEAISTPAGLDGWWTKRSAGEPVPETTYALGFGPGYDWEAAVRSAVPGETIEWEFTTADADWLGTRVGFHLTPRDGFTQVRFHHRGWPEPNDHYRTSSFCWAMYLRILKRGVEHGEVVPYEQRLDV
jgi:uncharacterized protein YndB with AHSA1/START domain